MIDYPNKLNKIFEKLELNKIKPIIIGGYIRDKILKFDSKDIDIELYGVDSLQKVETLLSEFGSVCSVGVSFSVCKLRLEDLDLDFSLPRLDNKVASGHRGFEIITKKNLDFKTAASRRDFTINAMGFDVEKKVLLDPFSGMNDLKNRTLRAVDIQRFDEDPLRVLRAIGFSTRFNFKLSEDLHNKCKKMIQEGVLHELSQERIFEEFVKIFLKSKKISHAFSLLEELGAFKFFNEFNCLSHKEFQSTIESLDFLNKTALKNEKKTVTYMLGLLCREFNEEKINSFLQKLTKERAIYKDVHKLIDLYRNFEVNNSSNYKLYALAKEIKIEDFLHFLDAAFLGKRSENIEEMKILAKKLNIYTKKMPAFVEGKDLIALGLKPSVEFSQLLEKTYDAQMLELFKNKKDALVWLKSNLLA